MFKKLQVFAKENPALTLAFLLTAAVYSKFLSFGHISWDDPEMVFNNTAVKSFNIRYMFTDHFVGNYIPVTMLLHALGWVVFNASDAGHHFINILFHLVNGVLVYRIGKRLFQNETIVVVGLIVFLLHPLQIESVAWISELKNVLSTTFYLGGLLFYLIYRAKNGILYYYLCFLFFILGCLSKSSVVVLPLSLICLDLLLTQKVKGLDLLNKVPFLITSLLIGIINIKTQMADQFINHAHEFPIYQRIAFAGVAFIKYLYLFLVPVKLSVIYPYPELKWSVFMLGFFMLALILGLIVYLMKRRNFSWLSVVLFVIVNLVLVLQFLPFGEVLYADRYLYVAIIGLAWVMGAFVSLLKIKTQTTGIILAVLFSVLGFARVGAWKNSITLYEDILKKYPKQFVALNSAGVECMFMNEDRKALAYFGRAIEAAPNNYKGYYNMGLLFLKNGSPKEAIENFDQTLRMYNYVKAYTGRAAAYYLAKDIPKAIQDAQTAIKMDSKNDRAHFVLGNCYNDLNELDEALKEYNKAIAINAGEADHYFKRAIVYGKKQDFKSSLGDLEICLSLNSEYYEAYYWKGVARVNLKQDPCADLKMAAQHHFEPAVIAYTKYCQ